MQSFPVDATAFLILFARVGAVLMLLPMFSEDSVPPRIRLMIAFGLSAGMWPIISPTLLGGVEKPLVNTMAMSTATAYADFKLSLEWRWPNGGGWRLDHVLSKGVEARACAYVHQGREAASSTVLIEIWGGIEKPLRLSRRRAPATGVSTVKKRVS